MGVLFGVHIIGQQRDYTWIMDKSLTRFKQKGVVLMEKRETVAQEEMERKYKELMDSIDEMEGEDERQVEAWKAVLTALVNEAFGVEH